jgi:hypothetical protein
MSLKVGLLGEIKETKADMIKWMFIFWASQMAATVAIIKLFVK